MRTIKLISFALVLFTSYGQAQDQTKTIEINNDNGELFISFANGAVTEFVVNDEPVEKDRYSEYQDIIDDFSNDGTQPVMPAIPAPPPIPEPPVIDEVEVDQNKNLRIAIIDFLADNSVIRSVTKYKVKLRREYLKVNGKQMSDEIHNACLDLFEEIYEHELNDRSEVFFKKSKNSSRSSISIID